MSKALILGLLGGGGLLATAVVVGKNFFSQALESLWYDLSYNVDELKKEVKEDKCIRKTFPGLASLDQANLQDVGKPDEAKLGTEEKDPVVGCLAVNWDKFRSKEEKHKDKWSGNFRFLWTFAKGNSGFLVYFTADTPETPPDTGAKLKGKVLTRVLTKNTTDNSWSINKGKEEEKSEWDVTKLPKFANGLNKKDDISKWKFAEESKDLEKLCSKDDCADGKIKRLGFFRGYWLWGKGDEKTTKETPDKWSTNLAEWWKEIYDESKWKVADTLGNIQGRWEPQGVFRWPTN